jgi:hypothetical protein
MKYLLMAIRKFIVTKHVNTRFAPSINSNIGLQQHIFLA